MTKASYDTHSAYYLTKALFVFYKLITSYRFSHLFLSSCKMFSISFSTALLFSLLELVRAPKLQLHFLAIKPRMNRLPNLKVERFCSKPLSNGSCLSLFFVFLAHRYIYEYVFESKSHFNVVAHSWSIDRFCRRSKAKKYKHTSSKSNDSYLKLLFKVCHLKKFIVFFHLLI